MNIKQSAFGTLAMQSKIISMTYYHALQSLFEDLLYVLKKVLKFDPLHQHDLHLYRKPVNFFFLKRMKEENNKFHETKTLSNHTYRIITKV